MVTGFTKFKEKFQGFEDQYVVIGGTACDLLMENEDMTFRATKDVDIVLIVESITAEFGKAFWEYIKEAEYEHKNKSTGNTQFYRFTSPKSKEYPFMIENFSKKPEFIVLDENAVLTPLPIDDEISSLSAILLNDAYYDLLKDGQVVLDGIPVLKEVCLIPFKAKAWLDLTERKENGESVDNRNIKKHKKDVFCLGQLIIAESRQALNEEIAADMKCFLNEMGFYNILSSRKKQKKEAMIDGYAGFILLDKNGNPKVAMHIQKVVQRLCEKYNEENIIPLPRITPHVFRHTFCTNMANAGMDLKSLQYRWDIPMPASP